jgi:predicted metal-dependent phosphoesterase TrpH
MRRRLGRIAIALALVAAPMPAPAAHASQPTPLVGALHEHSGYSDGWPGSRPSTYFASGRSFGLDFMGSSEHSDNADLPIVASEECLNPLVAPDCALADKEEPENSFRKWDATLEQASGATTDRFTAFRGFEWTSDRFGHINVYFSQHDANAKGDGGYATVDAFYSWFARAASLGGGSDGIATFNHPGAKSLFDGDPGFNWSDFAYVPAADDRMVGIEAFNDNDDFAGPGNGGGYIEGAYAHALDKGWHVGAVGAEDLGHRRSDDWGGPTWPKTVILSYGRSEQALKSAMLARRFYAIRTPDVRLTYTVDGRPMGSRLAPTEGRRLEVRASVNDPAAKLELVTSFGQVVASGLGNLSAKPRATADQRWYFVRASRAGEPIAYSSPVWVNARHKRGPDGGEWLAGDLHVHTCFSHDAYCPPDDENTGPDEFYTASLSPGGRFLEASARGLDFLAITDHNDVRSSADPDFASFGVIGIPGYENSLRGHAQMLGATRIYDNQDGSPEAVRAIADSLRADGGAFQANHPADGIEQPFDDCGHTGVLDWEYAYDVQPDTIEVWNPTSSIQVAERYWECWLDRGARVGATGGSDTHWAWTTPVQGAGNPTTWAFAREPTRAAVLEAIRAGRTTISRIPPSQGGRPLLLEADRDGNSAFESTAGDTVPPGSSMRVVSESGGILRVRANGETLLEQPVTPGGTVEFTAPAEDGWVRASLVLPEAEAAKQAPGCEPNGAPISTCAYDQLVAALSSPIYLGR